MKSIYMVIPVWRKHVLRILWSILLIFTFLIGIVSVSADTIAFDEVELMQEGKFPKENRTSVWPASSSSKLTEEKITELKTYLYNSLVRFESPISLKDYNLTIDEFKAIYRDLLNDTPRLFITSGGYSYYYDDYNGIRIITRLIPTYFYTKSDLEIYDSEVKRILDKVDPDWSDLEKIVFIHDYMVSNYEYDLEYSISSAYEMFISRKGICQAYTLTFMELVRNLGIEVHSVIGVNHTWNVVKLNGNWYHVDTTWDDPLWTDFYIRPGYVRRVYLLISDAAIRDDSSHSTWTDSDLYECLDTTYENYYWWGKNDICSPFVYANGAWYAIEYIDKAYWICSYDIETGFKSKILALNDGAFTYRYSLGFFDDKLYYLSNSGIKTYDLTTKKTALVYSNSEKSYSSFVIDDEMLYYEQKDYRQGTYTLKSDSEAEAVLQVSSELIRDEESGKVVGFTLVYLKEYILERSADLITWEPVPDVANEGKYPVDTRSKKSGYFRVVKKK